MKKQLLLIIVGSLFTFFGVYAQKVIYGKVIDGSNGEPLPGVNVLIEGSNEGTVTNLEGQYEITVDGSDAILSFSYVGYLNEIVPVNNQSEINISLSPDIQSLDEIVVVGYGTQKKSDLTGAVASVNAEELENIPAPGIDRALQGRVAGVTVNANGGAPGSGTTVRIRGMGSIYGANGPLYVVDGIPLADDNISNVVNPADIESIEVLKDAASAAIYGSRGSNGVIIITTRKGTSQEPKITLNAWAGTSNPVNTPDVANAQEYIDLALIYFDNTGRPLPRNIRTLQADSFRYEGPGTNWWDAVTREQGTLQNYDFSMTGGSDNFTYATGAGYYSHKGFIKSSSYERFNFRLNTSYKFLDMFTAGTNMSFTNYTYKGISENNPEGGVVAKAYQLSPLEAVWKDQDELIETANAGYDTTKVINRYAPVNSGGNIVRNVEQDNSFHKENVLFGNVFLEANLFDHIKIRSEYGMDVRRRDNYNFNPRFWSSNVEVNEFPTVSRGYEFRNNWVSNNIITYDESFGQHNFTLMAGATFEEFNYEDLFGSARNMPSEDPGFWYIDSAEEIIDADGGASESALMSYLGRLNYSFASKYLLTFNIRRDGTSKFRTEDGRAWGVFPSISGGWVISKENFFQSLNADWVNRVKLRASWGQVGNQAIPNNAFRPVLTSSERDFYAFGPGEIFYTAYRPANNANPFLHWETSESINYGADINLFGNRVQFTGEYFIRKTIDNLMIVPLPEYAGTPSAWANIGEIHNRGTELALTYNNFDGAFNYSIGGNITFLTNEVVNLGPTADQIVGDKSGRLGFSSNIARNGHPIGEFYGYEILGVFDTEEEIAAYLNDGGNLIQPEAEPGDFQFADIAGAPDENGNPTGPDGIINEFDKTGIGSPHPDFVYGFTINLAYKGFELDMFFQGQYGNDVFMYQKFYNNKGYNGGFNQISGLEEISWTGPNTTDKNPKLGGNPNNYQMSEWWLSDGSYFRAKNITLAYNLPASILSNVKLSGLKIYVTAENLLTLTKYRGMDPEIPSGYGLNLGIDRYTYPVARNIIGGVKFNF